MGLLSPFLYFLFVTTAFARLGAFGRTDEAYVLNATWPVLMWVISLFIAGEKLTIRSGVSLFIGFIGVLYILTGNFAWFRLSDWYGDLMALLAATVFGSYSALLGTPRLKLLLGNLGPTGAVLGFQTFSFAYALVYLLITARPVIPTWSELGLLALAGAGSFGLAYVFLYYARSLLNAATVAVFMFPLPILALLVLAKISGHWPVRAYWVGLLGIGVAGLLQTPIKKYILDLLRAVWSRSPD
jgi:drug/metabolite transporter (DMT)-like permease